MFIFHFYIVTCFFTCYIICYDAYLFFTIALSHCSFSLPGRTSPVLYVSFIQSSGFVSISFCRVSSVRLVKYLPFLQPAKSPYLKDRYNTPPLFKLSDTFCSTAGNSSMVQCSKDAHAHTPSNSLCQFISSNSI